MIRVYCHIGWRRWFAPSGGLVGSSATAAGARATATSNCMLTQFGQASRPYPREALLIRLAGLLVPPAAWLLSPPGEAEESSRLRTR